ncbi:hypothetical protein D3C78_1631980 [compost metagenome]
MNIEALGINFREHVKRAIRLHARHARNIVNQFPRAITLLIQAPARDDKFADALITAKRSLNRVLCRNVCTQTHRCQHLQAFNIAFSVLFRTVKDHPSLTETRHAVSF